MDGSRMKSLFFWFHTGPVYPSCFSDNLINLMGTFHADPAIFLLAI